eukprot:gene17442-biopygen26396
MSALFAALVIGTVAGTLIGTIGAGAGALLVPSLMFFAGQSMQGAVGVTLAMQTIPVGIGGAYLYYKQGLIDLWVVAAVAIGMLAGILGGGALATSGEISPVKLELLLGVVLVVLGGVLRPGRRPGRPGSWVLGPGSWVLGPGSWVLGPGSWVLGPGSWVLGPGSWVLGPRVYLSGGPGQPVGIAAR